MDTQTPQVQCKSCKKSDVTFKTFRGKQTLNCVECLLKQSEKKKAYKLKKQSEESTPEPESPKVEEPKVEEKPVKPKKQRKSKK